MSCGGLASTSQTPGDFPGGGNQHVVWCGAGFNGRRTQYACSRHLTCTNTRTGTLVHTVHGLQGWREVASAPPPYKALATNSNRSRDLSAPITHCHRHVVCMTSVCGAVAVQ